MGWGQQVLDLNFPVSLPEVSSSTHLFVTAAARARQLSQGNKLERGIYNTKRIATYPLPPALGNPPSSVKVRRGRHVHV